MPGQLGLEPTPDAYVQNMVGVFREVRRVLKDDGTVWLNLGDSYSRDPGKGGSGPNGKHDFIPDYGNARRHMSEAKGSSDGAVGRGDRAAVRVGAGLAQKQLVGIPWRVAFALQADGWYLRSDIIWSKPNPMPESVTDRPTKAHEYIFLLSKSARYYYDADAIAETSQTAGESRVSVATSGSYISAVQNGRKPSGNGVPGRLMLRGDMRNKRTVWTVPTQPYPEAHFATYPEALIEPCILAGSRPAGKRCDCDEVIATPTGTGEIDDPSLVVGRAGFNRPRRMDEGTRPITRREQRSHAEQMRVSSFRDEMATAAGEAFAHYIRTDASGARPLPPYLLAEWRVKGWLVDAEPCRCPVMAADTVLDPFCGSGTTGAVAIRHGRQFIGIELNAEYLELERQRIGAVAPLFAQEILS